MDLFTPPPKKRKRVPTESPGPLKTKKVKTGTVPTSSTTLSSKKSATIAARPIQKNAKAGPSKPRKAPSDPVSFPGIRQLSQVSRPTSKKVGGKAAQKPILYLSSSDAESPSDPDRTPPLRILKPRKKPSSPKSKKSSRKKLSKQASEPVTPTSEKIIHLGDLELTDSEDDHPARSKPPAKRSKTMNKFVPENDVIDLCSTEEEKDNKTLLPSSPVAQVRVTNRVIVIDTTEDEHQDSSIPTNRRLIGYRSCVAPSSPWPTLTSPPQGCDVDKAPASPVTDDHSLPNPAETMPPSPQTEHDPVALQTFPKEALDTRQAKPTRFRPRIRRSGLATSKFKRPPRDIIFFDSDNEPTVDLQTPKFFSRCISSIKTAALVAQKRKRRDALALSSHLPQVNGSTSTGCVIPTKPPAVVPASPRVDPQISLSFSDINNPNVPSDASQSTAPQPNIAAFVDSVMVDSAEIHPEEIPEDIFASAVRLTNVIQSLKVSTNLDGSTHKGSTLAGSSDPLATFTQDVGGIAINAAEDISFAVQPQTIETSSVSDPLDLHIPTTSSNSNETSPFPSLSPSSPRPISNADLLGSESDSPSPVTPSHQVQAFQPPSNSTSKDTGNSIFDLDLSTLSLPMILDSSKTEEEDDDDISLFGLEFVYPDDMS